MYKAIRYPPKSLFTTPSQSWLLIRRKFLFVLDLYIRRSVSVQNLFAFLALESPLLVFRALITLRLACA